MSDKSISFNDPVGLHTLQAIAKANRFNRWMYEQFHRWLKGDVLEIGSGIGNISQFAIQDDLSITLSDYNLQYLEFLKEKFAGISNVKNILRIDLLHPDFQNHYVHLKGKYDSIFLLNVIEHLKDDDYAINNCQYLLKPGGNLIILAPAYNLLYCNLDKELGHFRRYNLKRLKKLFNDRNFTVLSGHYFNFIGIAGWFLFGKVFRRKSLGEEISTFNSMIPLTKWLDKLIMKKAGLSIIVTGQK